MALKSYTREGRRVVFYGCSTFPACRGSLGAYPDGRPMGTPGDKATRKARINAHRYFDSLWKATDQKKAKMTRSQAYAWLRRAMGLTDSEAHFAKFSLAQCEEAVRLIKEAHPETRDFWDRLSDGLDI